ncbi:MAG: hypothetical protein ABI461_11265 [Polyangiaceae bacterium]
MKSVSYERVLSPFLIAAAVISIMNCGGGHEDSFTTAGDADVVEGVTGVWMGTSIAGNTYTLTLCEDTSDRHTDVSCQTLHKVQGDGRGATETTQEPGGCGGCDYDYSVYVNGTLEGDDLESSKIQGQFSLARGDADGKLAFPYAVGIGSPGSAVASSSSISLTGEMDAPGSFDVTSLAYPTTTAPTDSGAVDLVDAGDSDAESDAAVVDSGSLGPAPSGSSSSGPARQRGDVTGVIFHRIGNATCPTP